MASLRDPQFDALRPAGDAGPRLIATAELLSLLPVS
jgi:hypothetical protein